jgi:hypothetical protein
LGTRPGWGGRALNRRTGRVGSGGPLRKDDLLRRVGPERVADLGLGASVERTGGPARGAHHRRPVITGGLSPIGRPIDDVYAATWARAIEKNRAYFRRYPTDRERVRDILRRLDDEDVRLPSGDRLTSRRFLQLGFRRRLPARPGVWRSDGEVLDTVQAGDERVRASEVDLEGQPPLLRLSRWLRGRGTTVEAVAFPVYRREKG